MAALFSVLVVVLLSLLLTRIATVALTLTGLSRESARFQARSAFSGVGFTTSEAESITGHPVRRRIVLALMLIGSAGIIGVIATLVLSFTGRGAGDSLVRVVILIAGLALLLLAARSSWLDRRLSSLIGRALRRWTDLDVRDYASLLELSHGYAVSELLVSEGGWLDGRSLGELGLREEGVAVLGVQRPDGGYIGAPGRGAVVRAGDTLVLYGRAESLEDLDRRPPGEEGDRIHAQRVAERSRLASEHERGG